MSKSSFTIYLPELSSIQVKESVSFFQSKSTFTESELDDGWQSEFLREFELKAKSIPWNLLRAKQFSLNPNVKTVVCCDPVVMQMTHRGAYFWGQQALNFSSEDVIRIVAQINKNLMEEGESFYLLDNDKWLYTSDKHLVLNQPSSEQYIGKDMFGFSYSGSDGMFWDKLALEIQMLLKQMIDYQGLSTQPAEHLVNVHFWGDTSARWEVLSRSSDSDNNILYTDDIQLLTFAENNHLATEPLAELLKSEFFSTKLRDNDLDIVGLVFNDVKANFDMKMVERCISWANKIEFELVRIVAGDKVLIVNQPHSFLVKLKKLLGF